MRDCLGISACLMVCVLYNHQLMAPPAECAEWFVSDCLACLRPYGCGLGFGLLYFQFLKKADRDASGALDINEFASFIEVCCVIDAKIKEGPPTKQIEFDGNLSFSSSTGGRQKVEEFSGAVTDGLTKLRSQPEVIFPSWHRLSCFFVSSVASLCVCPAFFVSLSCFFVF